MRLRTRILMTVAAIALFAAPLLAAEGEEEPKLIPGINRGLISALTTLIVFLILLLVLGRFAWGPIVASLKARESRIRKEIADAEDARAKAEETLREYSSRLAEVESKVREMLQSASVEGEKLAAGIRTRAQQEAEEAKERATRDIEAARKQAIKQIYAEAAELSTSIAEKILRRNLNPADQEDLVRSSLQELPANV